MPRAKVAEKPVPRKDNQNGRWGRERPKRVDLFQVRFTQLYVEPEFNTRYDMGDLRVLAAQIKAQGAKQVLHGAYIKALDKYRITEGHRRYFAMKLIFEQDGIDTLVFMRLEPHGYTAKQRLLDTFTLNDQKNLAPLEKAAGIKRLMDEHNMTEKQIADELGVSAAAINKINKLNKAPAELIELIRAGTISGTEAIKQIVAGKAQEFLERVKKGEFKPQLGEDDEEDIVSEGGGGYIMDEVSKKAKAKGKGKTAKLTAKNINKKKDEVEDGGTDLNSWSEAKKFLKGYKGKPKDPVVQKVLAFLLKLYNNGYTQEQIVEYFNK